jgi:hypothetical protein
MVGNYIADLTDFAKKKIEETSASWITLFRTPSGER